MTPWILVAVAIAAALAALCAELLARPATARAALAATAALIAAALGTLDAPTPVIAVFAVGAAGFLARAGAYALRAKLPPYAVGGDDGNED